MSFELIPIESIPTAVGSIFKVANSHTISEFGELYFTPSPSTCVKGWKCHTQTTLYLLPICGSVTFYFSEAHPSSPQQTISSITLLPPQIDSKSAGEYNLLLIQPNTWFAFVGADKHFTSTLMTLSSLLHNPAECLNFPFDQSHL